MLMAKKQGEMYGNNGSLVMIEQCRKYVYKSGDVSEAKQIIFALIWQKFLKR